MFTILVLTVDYLLSIVYSNAIPITLQTAFGFCTYGDFSATSQLVSGLLEVSRSLVGFESRSRTNGQTKVSPPKEEVAAYAVTISGWSFPERYRINVQGGICYIIFRCYTLGVIAPKKPKKLIGYPLQERLL